MSPNVNYVPVRDTDVFGSQCNLYEYLHVYISRSKCNLCEHITLYELCSSESYWYFQVPMQSLWAYHSCMNYVLVRVTDIYRSQCNLCEHITVYELCSSESYWYLQVPMQSLLAYHCVWTMFWWVLLIFTGPNAISVSISPCMNYVLVRVTDIYRSQCNLCEHITMYELCSSESYWYLQVSM